MSQDENQQESGPSSTPTPDAEIVEDVGRQHMPAPIKDKILTARDGAVDILQLLVDEVKARFDEAPKQVKKLSIPELLEQITELLKAMKSSTVVLPQQTVNKINEIKLYGDRFQAADEHLSRKETRVELRTKLKRRPS